MSGRGAPADRLGRAAPLLAALACFCAYTAWAVPTFYWLDSSEFAAAAFTLGIAHPPGHPLAALWGRLFVALPLGGVGFRVALSQAAAGALAAGALALLARDLFLRLELPPAAAGALGGAAGLLFGLSWGLAFQSVRPEVYALAAAASLAAGALALRADATSRLGPLGGAALFVGLGLGNHHFLALAGALPLAVLVARRWPQGARAAALVLAAGALALGLYLYLPLRARAAPLVDWGTPFRLERFLWLVTARAFQQAVHRASGSGLPYEAMLDLGPLGVLAAAGGLALLLRAPATRRAGLFLAGEMVAYGGAAALVGFDPSNPDSHGYLACALAYGAAAALVLPAALLRALAARGRRGLGALGAAGAAVLLLLGLSAPLRPGARAVSLARFDAAERILSAALEDAPPRATVSTSYYQSLFALWYLRGAEGARPDLVLRTRHLPVAGEPEGRARPQGATLYEYDLLTPPALAATLEPGALFYREGAAAPPGDRTRALAAQDALWARLLARLGPQRAEPQTRNLLVWTFYLQAEWRCRVGARSEGLAAAERARAENGADTPELWALRRRCGPP